MAKEHFELALSLCGLPFSLFVKKTKISKNICSQVLEDVLSVCAAKYDVQ